MQQSFYFFNLNYLKARFVFHPNINLNFNELQKNYLHP